MKQSKIEKAIKSLDNSFMKSWAEFLVLYDELKTYGNRQLKDEEWEVATKLIEEMENKYRNEIHPIAHFVTARLTFSTNVIKNYNDFADTLTAGEQKSKIIH